MTAKEAKQSLRKAVLAVRDQMCPEEAAAKSEAILRRLLASRAYREAACLYLYADTRNEVQMRALWQAAWADGKRTAFPRVEGREMVFCYVTGEADLETRFHGIREPKAECLAAAEEDALLVMPGAVYDVNGHRIGYGGGFYDRYLADHTHHVLAAPAYAFQVKQAIPAEPFDQTIPWILTEEREFFCGGGEA